MLLAHCKTHRSLLVRLAIALKSAACCLATVVFERSSRSDLKMSSDGAMRVAQVVVVDDALIEEVLGPPRFGENDADHRVSTAGNVAGLVWTEAGGQAR